MVASVESTSYAILLYPRDGVQVLSTLAEGRSSVMHSGFSKGRTGSVFWPRQGPYYRTTNDEEDSIKALPE